MTWCRRWPLPGDVAGLGDCARLHVPGHVQPAGLDVGPGAGPTVLSDPASGGLGRRDPGSDRRSYPRSSASAVETGAPGRSRTCDLSLRRRLLYPLSYWGGCGETGGHPATRAAADTWRYRPVMAIICSDTRNLARTSAYPRARSPSSSVRHRPIEGDDARRCAAPAQPELPSPYQPGKRRGRARRSHTVGEGPAGDPADAGHGERPVGGLSLPPPQRQPQRRRRLRPARRTGPDKSSSGPEAAPEHPGDGLRLP